jgi:hypothetical protein
MTDQQPPLWSRQPTFEEIVSPPVPEIAPDGLPEPGYYYKHPCLFPSPDGSRCCECEACHGMGQYASRRPDVSPPVPEDVQGLPYPACYSPESCRGLTFCPHERTCTE